MSNVIPFPNSKEQCAPADILEMAMDRVDDIASVIVIVTMDDGSVHVRHSEQTTGSLALAAAFLQQEALRRASE